MADRPAQRPENKSRRLSWKKSGKRDREARDSVSSTSGLPVPQEGRELSYDHPLKVASPPTASAASSTAPSSALPSRSSSSASIDSGPPAGPPSSLLTRTTSVEQASRTITNALERTASAQPGAKGDRPGPPSSFSRRSLVSMMSGFSLKSSSEDKERGRSEKKDKEKARARSSSYGTRDDESSDAGSIRARSQSPFHLSRRRRRDSSPTVEALSQSDVESDYESSIRPRNAFTLSGPSDDESDEEEDESDEESWTEDEALDPVTSRNTERNALIPADVSEADNSEIPDPLGEGVNMVIAPEPYFPSTLNTGTRGPRRRKSTRPHDTLPTQIGRAVYQPDRCTITVTHGNPTKVLEETGRRPKFYVLASDLSQESRYALEWGIGTVLRDGDEMLIVTVVENEAKVDPIISNPADRSTKWRYQQERQAMAYILVQQATSLLQRTRLNVTVSCQAWHAKNARHMLLDIVDYVEPTMLIVGSRGLGNIKGILLGSTSHYLIQKCSVPVMVARRRLKRPPRRSAHLAPHRARVSLAQAGIDRVAPKVDQDVAVMREQVERGDDRRDDGAIDDDNEDDPDTEVEGDSTPPLGRKVPGTVD